MNEMNKNPSRIIKTHTVVKQVQMERVIEEKA